MKKGYLYLIVAQANNHHFAPGTLVECIGSETDYGCSRVADGEPSICAPCESEGNLTWNPDTDPVFWGDYWNVGLDDVVEIGKV